LAPAVLFISRHTTFCNVNTLQILSLDSPVSTLRPYVTKAVHLVTATASDSVWLLALCALHACLYYSNDYDIMITINLIIYLL